MREPESDEADEEISLAEMARRLRRITAYDGPNLLEEPEPPSETARPEVPEEWWSDLSSEEGWQGTGIIATRVITIRRTRPFLGHGGFSGPDPPEEPAREPEMTEWPDTDDGF